MTSTISKAHRDGQNNYLHPLKMLQAIKKSNIGIKDYVIIYRYYVLLFIILYIIIVFNVYYIF